MISPAASMMNSAPSRIATAGTTRTNHTTATTLKRNTSGPAYFLFPFINKHDELPLHFNNHKTAKLKRHDSLCSRCGHQARRREIAAAVREHEALCALDEQRAEDRGRSLHVEYADASDMRGWNSGVVNAARSCRVKAHTASRRSLTTTATSGMTGALDSASSSPARRRASSPTRTARRAGWTLIPDDPAHHATFQSLDLERPATPIDHSTERAARPARFPRPVTAARAGAAALRRTSAESLARLARTAARTLSLGNPRRRLPPR